MTDNSHDDVMPQDSDEYHPNFCQDCGASFVKFDTFCLSRICETCNKEYFFVRRSEDGGLQVEQGEKIHTPQIILSLDPTSGCTFTKYGLEGFLKQVFLGKAIKSEDQLVGILKATETQLDTELNKVDCISHCDLDTSEGTGEASKILQSHSLDEHSLKLAWSVSLRECYTAIENGDALKSAHAAHLANIFKEYSLLENPHLKEIVWLGYGCYKDLHKNEGMTEQAAKEKRLIKSAVAKLNGFDEEYLYALSKDGKDIAPRLSLKGISESTLKSLTEYELLCRSQLRDDARKKEDRTHNTKIFFFGVITTLLTGFVIALFDHYLGP